MITAAVAAGHPATAEAGAEILAEGGSAADAAVAACLASCVAETVMTIADSLRCFASPRNEVKLFIGAPKIRCSG